MNVQDRINLFLKKEGFSPTPEMICPCFNSCNKNKCVLHSQYKQLEDHFEDKRLNKIKLIEGTYNFKCKCPKRIRKEIAEFFKLENQGLTEKEIAGQKRWENMPEAEKQAKKENLKKISLFHRLSKVGYTICRKAPTTTNLTQSNDLETPETSEENHISKANELPEIEFGNYDKKLLENEENPKPMVGGRFLKWQKNKKKKSNQIPKF